MSRNYYNVLLKERNKKRHKIKIISKFLKITVLLVIIVGIFYKLQKTISVNKIFSIQNVHISQNDTTIPNNIIYKYIQQNKTLNVFNYKKFILQLKDFFPEIKDIKLSYIPTKTIKIKIYLLNPIGFKKELNNELRFFSFDKGWYKIYNVSRINLSSLCELEGEIDVALLRIVYQKFNEISAWDKVKKFNMQKNKSMLYISSNNNTIISFIVNKRFENVSKEQLIKLLKYDFRENKTVDVQLLAHGKVYIE